MTRPNMLALAPLLLLLLGCGRTGGMGGGFALLPADFDPACLEVESADSAPVPWVGGTLDPAEWATRTVTLHNTCETPIAMGAPMLAEASTSNLMLSGTGLRIPGEGSSDLVVRIDPTVFGVYSTTIVIPHEEGDILVPFKVEVGAVRGRMAPIALTADRVKPGCVLRRTIELHSSGTWPLEVEALGDAELDEVTITTSDEGPWTLERGEWLELEVEVQVPSDVVRWQATLRPTTNHSYRESLDAEPSLALPIVVDLIEEGAGCL